MSDIVITPISSIVQNENFIKENEYMKDLEELVKLVQSKNFKIPKDEKDSNKS